MEEVQLVIRYGLVGIGANIVMDLWVLALRMTWNVPSLDFALVGRWVGHMRAGQWFHTPIAGAAPIPGERVLGWILHYLIGIVFALGFGLVGGSGWLSQPDLLSALVFGGLTVLFPFFIMQPAFGAGLAASKTPTPAKARAKSLITHLIFGAGLWLTATVLTAL